MHQPLGQLHVLKSNLHCTRFIKLAVVPTSRPVGQEGHCFLVICSSPWPRKEFDWNGDVATRVDCVPQRLNSLGNIYAKG